MTFLPGSEADQLALCDALDRCDLAELIAIALNLRCGAENEYARWNELAVAAAKCGWNFQTNQTCIDWSRRRVATIRSSLRRAA